MAIEALKEQNNHITNEQQFALTVYGIGNGERGQFPFRNAQHGRGNGTAQNVKSRNTLDKSIPKNKSY